MPPIEQLERLRKLDPNDPFVPYAIAQEHAKAGRHEEAVVEYDKCLALDAAYCYGYYHKAKSLETLGRKSEAAAVLREGAAVARKHQDAKALSEIEALLMFVE
jgi:tetratricopeptide (TPR) repeat protein